MSAAKITTGAAVGLAVGMLVTGSINTLSTKWADNTYSTGRDGSYAQFQHPFLQAFGMFIGESLCLLAFFTLNWRARRAGREEQIERASPDLPWYIFAAPATCDLMGTSLMYLGLTYTAASTFQMLRGSVVIFTGVMSVLFLKRTLRPFHWLGMLIVLSGLACVGISSIVFGKKSASASNPVLGDTLVVCAQLIAATQMVVEEKLLDKYKVPALQAVGMEGVFGMLFMGILLIIFQNIPGLPDSADTKHFEDSLDALHRLGNNYKIMIATLGNVFSIAWFNFFGLSVTKNMSATTRMVLDSIRTLVVWGVDLALGWEQFQYLQILGFALLLAGTAIYNKILPVPNCYFDHRWWDAHETDASLQSADAEVSMEDAANASKGIHAINLQRPLLSDPQPNGQRYSDQY